MHVTIRSIDFQKYGILADRIGFTLTYTDDAAWPEKLERDGLIKFSDVPPLFKDNHNNPYEATLPSATLKLCPSCTSFYENLVYPLPDQQDLIPTRAWVIDISLEGFPVGAIVTPANVLDG